MNNEIADDLRLSFVVMKNELKKFFRGRKVVLFGALTAVIIILLAAVLIYEGVEDDLILSSYSMVVGLLILSATAFFSATTLVSEFEERTALILFTKPVRKISIFAGKLLASYVLTVFFVGIYYISAAIVYAIQVGEFKTDLVTSFILSLCYMVAATGIAMILSSILKKASTSTIMTFIILMLIMPTISAMLMIGNVDNWWMLDQAVTSISDVFGTMTFDEMGHMIFVHDKDPEALKNGLVMVIWGLVSTIGAYFIFRNKDFRSSRILRL